MANKLAVVALGGNALLRDNEKGTIEEQEKPRQCRYCRCCLGFWDDVGRALVCLDRFGTVMVKIGFGVTDL